MNVVAPVLPGETFGGKYRVERIIGQGGMGVVVAARHIDLDERVAIKFLLGQPSSTAVDRFLREARAAVKVKGEHVCRVLDFGRLETGEPYIVMEHLEGTDLAKKLAREGAQPVSTAVQWIIEVGDALAEAHDLGIVHRDVKPANIFLAQRNDGATTAKMLDFGISRLASHAKITGTQSPMGSPSYMSPEQMVSAHDVDARTDVWSLGVTLYELLAGRPPFVADSMVQLSVVVRERDPEPLEGVAPGLARVIAKCLAKAPEDRHASVAALVAELAPFAPEDASLLVRRHRRRSTAGDPAALAETTPSPDVHAARVADKECPPARTTFAPLQSTLAEGRRSSPPQRRRTWPWVAVALVGLAFSGIGAASRAEGQAMEQATGTEQATGNGESEREGQATSEGESVIGSPSVAAVVARDAGVIVGSATATPRRKTVSAVAVDAAMVAAPSASSLAAAAPAKAPEARKRRELDRDDP